MSRLDLSYTKRSNALTTCKEISKVFVGACATKFSHGIKTTAVGGSRWLELLLRFLYVCTLHGLLNFISHFRIFMCCSPLNENKFPPLNFSVLIKPQNCSVNRLSFIRLYLFSVEFT